MYKSIGLALLLLYFAPVQAGWLDWLMGVAGDSSGDTTESRSDTPESSTAAPATAEAAALGLNVSDISSGLKQALSNGVGHAITQLSKENGFLGNEKVRIPLPKDLSLVDKTLRNLGQDRYADEFVNTLNRAAEASVAQIGPVFTSAIQRMTVDDAVAILKGSDNAATTYFRTKTESTLLQKIKPITAEATSSVGVTAAYKQLIDKLGFAKDVIQHEAVDLDQYITGKTLDGLFLMIAEQEKKIREQPVERTTDLLKRVFESVAK